MFERKNVQFPWDGKMKPFRVIGNVYFVGTYQASSHLIDTGEGLILIDTGYSETLYLLIHSIYQLGFAPADIKYIINTHWHDDHTGGTAALADLSGAKTVIGREDQEKAKVYFQPDITVKHGDHLRLGNTDVLFLETPGHTKGTVSVFFETEDGGKRYRVGMFGGAGANTLVEGKFDYEDCRRDYLRSLELLRKEKVDVFIGNHTWNNDTEGKGEILSKTGKNLFVDPSLWERFLDHCENRLLRIIEKDPGLD